MRVAADRRMQTSNCLSAGRCVQLQISDLHWIEQGLTSHYVSLDTFRSFRRRWGDCGISQDCSRSQSPQCVRCWVVCARPLLVTVVCMCIIWKALCPYVLDARLGLWVFLEHAFTCVSITNQAGWRSSATHLLARWEHERTTAWWQTGRVMTRLSVYPVCGWWLKGNLVSIMIIWPALNISRKRMS